MWWKTFPVGARVLMVIALILMLNAALSDYVNFIPKLTSYFFAAIGSIAILVLWLKYGHISKTDSDKS